MSHQLTINKHSFVFVDVRFKVGAAVHGWPLEVSQTRNIWIHRTVIQSIAHDDTVKFL